MRKHLPRSRRKGMSVLPPLLMLAALIIILPDKIFADGIETIVANVDTVWVPGGVGPVMGLNENVVPIMAGDEFTATAPSIAAVASPGGSGCAVGFGQEGFFTDEHIGFFDNLQIAINAVAWLDKCQRKRVLIVTGHGEWCGYSTTVLQNRLTQLGYSVALSNGAITATNLQGVGVLFAGNIWWPVTAQEMAAIQSFYTGGGGLFLMGVGWSWVSSNPRMTLDDYPMNQIGALCGIRWTDGGISDPVHKFQDYPLFLHFFPEQWLNLQNVPGSMSYINSATSAHALTLRADLQSDQTFRAEYEMAHATLAWGLHAGISSYPQMIYDFYTNLVASYPQYFHKNFAYNFQTESTILQVRERVGRTLTEALPLTPLTKTAIGSTLALAGRTRDIWDSFSILLMDNSSLDVSQLEFLYQYLASLPAGLHSLCAISVADFLGSTTPPVNLGDDRGCINIIGWSIGSATENSFPDDIAPATTDVFCVVAAHEVNHAVDNFTSGSSAVIAARRQALIQAAGDDSLNYLRSMCARGFFTQNPQEFFASMANEWFTDSWQTMRLGLSRFDRGRSQPLNQAIFFADVYSQGRDSTYFYRVDPAGHLSRSSVFLTRDTRGHITSMLFDGVVHTFSLDTAGNVLAVALPIQLESFTVTAVQGGTILRWKTISETKNYGFEIQTSTPPTDYITVPGVFIAGHGNSIDPHEYTWTDPRNRPGEYYRLKQTDLDGAVHFSEGKSASLTPPVPPGNTVPSTYVLQQNYPNPFNPSTTIAFDLPRRTSVRLSVYDPLGRQVLTMLQGEKEAGSYTVTFDGSLLASGIYIYRLQAGSFVQSRKMLLTK